MQNEQDNTNAPKPKGKTAALVSLILAVAGFVFLGLTSIPAIIFGIVALVKMRKSKGLILSRTFAVSGIILGIVIFFSVSNFISDSNQHSERFACRNYIFSAGNTAKVYANDHGGELPPADKWHEIFISEYNCDPKMFTCPSANSDECTYAINVNIAGRNLNKIPPDTVLFFEIEGGSNIFGGPELLVARHTFGKRKDRTHIVFADGHSEFIKTENIDSLRWKPEQEN